MLPERCRELLTAYVDGELSARQRRHALRLLRRSAEARRLLQRLQSDSDALISLPKVRPDRDLTMPVLQKIAAGQPRTLRPARRLAVPRAYPAWVGAAAAALVLGLIGTASYCFFSATQHRDGGPAVVRNQTNPPPDVPNVQPPPAGDSHDVALPNPNPEHKSDPVPPVRPPSTDVAQHPMTDPDPTPMPVPPKDDSALTAPGIQDFPDLKDIPKTDFLSTFKLRDLDDKKLAAALSKDALHVEMPVADAHRALERLEGVLKAHHVDLLIDASAESQGKGPFARLPANYVLYTEDLTPDELAPLLQQLGAEDKKAAEKKPAEGAFDALVVHPMSENDHKVLKKLMGVDPTQVAPPKETAGVDPRKPLADQTGAQVAATLGQGKPGAKAANEHPMLVLPDGPFLPKHDSAEVTAASSTSRKPLRTGAVPVLLVLRGTNAR